MHDLLHARPAAVRTARHGLGVSVLAEAEAAVSALILGHGTRIDFYCGRLLFFLRSQLFLAHADNGPFLAVGQILLFYAQSSARKGG